MGEALVKEKTVRTRCHITVTQMSSQRDDRVCCYQDKCIAVYVNFVVIKGIKAQLMRRKRLQWMQLHTLEIICTNIRECKIPLYQKLE